LLLDRHGYLKITDFGFAKQIDFKTYTLCGTPEYIAPEVLLSKGHNKGVDWWTLGILIYEMLTGEPPFVDDDPMRIYQKILSNKLNFPKKGYEKSARWLTKKFLTSDLTKRYGCLKNESIDVKKAEWFKDTIWSKLIQKQLVAPIIPEVCNDSDTSNFEEYSDSEIEASIPNILGIDPFEDF
jgi:serine/threonine protein kinase